MSREIRVVADADALAQAGAELIADTVRGCGGTIALSGGSTPRAIYRLLAQPLYRENLPWEHIHLFWGDERAVPPDHPDNNYRMTAENFIDQVPLPAANVHRIQTELPPAEAATAYQAELERFFGAGNPPRFDLVLLGMGDDGHTASLFPHTAALDEETRWVVANHVTKLDADRITLTLPVLNQARRVVFLVSGAGKAATLKRVLEGPRVPAELPSQLIAPEQGELLWLVDRPAAANLNPR